MKFYLQSSLFQLISVVRQDGAKVREIVTLLRRTFDLKEIGLSVGHLGHAICLR